MFYLKSNVHSFIEGIRVDGFFEFLIAGNEGYLNLEITYPYSEIRYSLDIIKEQIYLYGEILDPTNTDVIARLLGNLYCLCRYFNDRIDIVKERFEYHKNSEEYEKFCVYNCLQMECDHKLREVYDSYTCDIISNLPPYFEEQEQQLLKYKSFTDNYRFPLFDEISEECGIQIDQDLIRQFCDKYNLQYKSIY